MWNVFNTIKKAAKNAIKKENIKKVLRSSLKDLIILLPVFFIAIVISVVAEAYIPDIVIQSILGKNLIIAILVATAAGILLPFPKYTSYPFAAFLYSSGAHIGAVFAFIAGEVFIGNVFEDYLEIKYFSFRFWIMRFFVSFVLIFIGALIFQVLI